MEAIPSPNYVLMTQEGTYLVEYLIGEVVFATSISRAMIFTNLAIAHRFKTLLYERFGIKVTVHPYIYYFISNTRVCKNNFTIFAPTLFII